MSVDVIPSSGMRATKEYRSNRDKRREVDTCGLQMAKVRDAGCDMRAYRGWKRNMLA
jgi:hypothetical protein